MNIEPEPGEMSKRPAVFENESGYSQMRVDTVSPLICRYQLEEHQREWSMSPAGIALPINTASSASESKHVHVKNYTKRQKVCFIISPRLIMRNYLLNRSNSLELTGWRRVGKCYENGSSQPCHGNFLQVCYYWKKGWTRAINGNGLKRWTSYAAAKISLTGCVCVSLF